MVRRQLAKLVQAGSIPVARSNCPRSTTVVQQFRKLPVPVQLRPRAPAPRKCWWLHSRFVNEQTRFDSVARLDKKFHSPTARWPCARLLTGGLQVRVLLGELMRVRPTGEALGFHPS